VLSLHITKVFNTCEGGAIICPDDKSKLHIDHLKNFGFVGETTVVASGINGKMNKMQSALGLLQLKHVDQALARRHAIDGQDREGLGATPGIRLLPRGSQVVDNHAYFPILVDDAYPLSRDQFYDKLKAEGISSLRFSYPPITEFPMYRGLPSVQATDLSTHPHPGLPSTQPRL
jgi:dTDP-4-amino-4,6-dideoxygalactose transaminase